MQNPEKIQNHSNQTQNSLKKIDIQVQMKNYCRICLSEGAFSSGSQKNLISPCNCFGSLEYVHNECISLWIKKRLKLKQKNEGLSKIKCEICKEEMQYQLIPEFKTKSCEAIKLEIQKRKLLFGLLIFILFAVLSFLGYLGYFLSLGQEQDQETNQFVYIMSGAAGVLFIGSIFIFLYFFIFYKGVKEVNVHNKKKS